MNICYGKFATVAIALSIYSVCVGVIEILAMARTKIFGNFLRQDTLLKRPTFYKFTAAHFYGYRC